MTRKIILVRPDPDIIVLSAIHKYHILLPWLYKDIKNPETRIEYTEAYTLTTLTEDIIAKSGYPVTKILIAGHGGDPELGFGIKPEEIKKIAERLVNSQVISSLRKIVLSACYSFHPREELSSIYQLKIAIAKQITQKQIQLTAPCKITGYGGATVTGGNQRRIVVRPDKYAVASQIQEDLLKKYPNIKSHELFPGWKEDLSSDQIFKKAADANSATEKFFQELRETFQEQGCIGSGFPYRKSAVDLLVQV